MTFKTQVVGFSLIKIMTHKMPKRKTVGQHYRLSKYRSQKHVSALEEKQLPASRERNGFARHGSRIQDSVGTEHFLPSFRLTTNITAL